MFGTPAAREWLRLLEAIERPTSPRARARGGADAVPRLERRARRRAGDDEWEDVHRRLHDWARVLRRRGVAALAETITLVEGLPGARARVATASAG